MLTYASPRISIEVVASEQGADIEEFQTKGGKRENKTLVVSERDTEIALRFNCSKVTRACSKASNLRLYAYTALIALKFNPEVSYTGSLRPHRIVAEGLIHS
jgi:hypothetical protein